MNAPVLFAENVAHNGMRYGIASLNAPRTLNGLSLEMCHRLDAQLRGWADDVAIAFVILRGEGDPVRGERAFCAGGDLQSLYKSILSSPSDRPSENAYAREFFEVEYRLDFRIHRYPKPILCWGNGYVMGGGVGLMMGASHRVVSETSRVAMPEVSIGLFPDVGGSWMLNRVPDGLGLFLGLTGVQLNASDTLFAGIADFAIESADWPALNERLREQPWTRIANAQALEETGGRIHRTPTLNDELLREAIMGVDNSAQLAPGPLQENAALIGRLCRGDDLNAIVAALIALNAAEDPWLATCATALAQGAPGSARLAFALRDATRGMCLADIFRLEYVVALNCVARADLKEGIRALLIDKDKCPHWSQATVSEASAQWAEAFLDASWLEGRPHPLADLGMPTR
jgi:enoyl-CoA hydratase/carnithine racemase